jgi:hypothetical protein
MGNALTGIGPVAESLQNFSSSLGDTIKMMQQVSLDKAKIREQVAARQQEGKIADRAAAQKRVTDTLGVAKTHGPKAAASFQQDQQINQEAGIPGKLSQETLDLLQGQGVRTQSRSPVFTDLTPELAKQLGIGFKKGKVLAVEPDTGKFILDQTGQPVISSAKTSGIEEALSLAGEKNTLARDLADVKHRLAISEQDNAAKHQKELSFQNFKQDVAKVLGDHRLNADTRVIAAVEMMYKLNQEDALADPELRSAFLASASQGKIAFPFPRGFLERWKNNHPGEQDGTIVAASGSYIMAEFGDPVKGAKVFFESTTPNFGGGGDQTKQQELPSEFVGTIVKDGKEVNVPRSYAMKQFNDALASGDLPQGTTFQEYLNMLANEPSLQFKMNTAKQTPKISTESTP